MPFVSRSWWLFPPPLPQLHIHDVSVRQSTTRSRLNAIRQARSKVNGRKMPPRGRIRSRSIEAALPVCLNTQNCNIPGEIVSQNQKPIRAFWGLQPELLSGLCLWTPLWDFRPRNSCIPTFKSATPLPQSSLLRCCLNYQNTRRLAVDFVVT